MHLFFNQIDQIVRVQPGQLLVPAGVKKRLQLCLGLQCRGVSGGFFQPLQGAAVIIGGLGDNGKGKGLFRGHGASFQE